MRTDAAFSGTGVRSVADSKKMPLLPTTGNRSTTQLCTHACAAQVLRIRLYNVDMDFDACKCLDQIWNNRMTKCKSGCNDHPSTALLDIQHIRHHSLQSDSQAHFCTFRADRPWHPSPPERPLEARGEPFLDRLPSTGPRGSSERPRCATQAHRSTAKRPASCPVASWVRAHACTAKGSEKVACTAKDPKKFRM